MRVCWGRCDILLGVNERGRKYQVKELPIFGSALRDDFRDDSDVDLLVEFSTDAHASLFEF